MQFRVQQSSDICSLASLGSGVDCGPDCRASGCLDRRLLTRRRVQKCTHRCVDALPTVPLYDYVSANGRKRPNGRLRASVSPAMRQRQKRNRLGGSKKNGDGYPCGPAVQGPQQVGCSTAAEPRYRGRLRLAGSDFAGELFRNRFPRGLDRTRNAKLRGHRQHGGQKHQGSDATQTHVERDLNAEGGVARSRR